MRFLGIALLAPALLLLQAGPALAQQETTVELSPLAGSGVSGTATLTAMDGATRVMLSVSGMRAGSSGPAHIHLGTCAQQGGVQFNLGTLQADMAGRASLTATVNASLASLMDGNHHIQAPHAMTCGAIAAAPAARAAPPAAPRPARAGGPELALVVGTLGALGAAAIGGGLVLLRRREA